MLIKYLTLQKILQHMPSHKELRSFALKHKNLNNLKLLFKYLQTKEQNYSFAFIKWLYLISFILGVIISIGLLSYNGSEPVNLLYFLFVVIIVPLISAFFTLIAFLSNKKAFFLGYFLEKIITSFTKEKISIKNKKVQKWFELKILLFAQLLFGIGILIGFLFKVTFSDIAFAWSTTLNINVNEIYKILHLFSLPWQGIINDYLSIELLKNTQFYHLNSIKQHLMPNILGLWWKYLCCATLFYMIFLRFILFAIATFFYHKSIKEAILKEGAILIEQFNTPLIQTKTTHSNEKVQTSLSRQASFIKDEISFAIAWNFSNDEALFLKEKFPKGTIFTLSALDSYEKEDKLLTQIKAKKIALFVKSWESPTKDFLDFLQKLQKHFFQVTLFLVGEDFHKVNKKDAAIWQESLKNYSFLKFALV